MWRPRSLPLDLKPAQLDVLMNLYRHPGMSQHDLARKLLVGRSNITMLVPQMESAKLLKREGDAKDKRGAAADPHRRRRERC